MENDEDRTHSQLMRLRSRIIEPRISAAGGRIVKNTGDGFLAAFEDVVVATQCAIAMQNAIIQSQRKLPHDRRIQIRMGLHQCETIVEAQDIYGDGVNIAARLQSYAEPGDVVVSSSVAEQISSAVDVPIVDLGDLYLKNLTRPIHAFELLIGTQTKPKPRLDYLKSNRPSIAVLPFRMPQSDPEEAYFADGIVEDIVRALGGLKELLVISRSSTLQYSGATVDVRTVGRELGVRYVMTGTMRRAAGRIRIATELSDAESGIVIRADRYEGGLTDLFDLQDEISRRVLATIAPHVHEWELQRSMRKHPENLDAYDLTLQGMDLLYRLDYESFSRARGLFQQAIVHDPSYAPAYAYAAMWHIFRIGQGWSSDRDSDAMDAARMAAEGIERDKFDALALAFHGHARSWFLKQYDAAVVFLDRALEASPNCAMAWALNGCTCAYIGDGPAAVERVRHALRLAPSDPHAFYYLAALTVAHYANGTYEDTVASGRTSAALNERFVANKRFLVGSIVALGRMEEARKVARDLLRVQPRFRVTRYIPRCPFKDPAVVSTFHLSVERSGTA
jgi:adenylate cyclase